MTKERFLPGVQQGWFACPTRGCTLGSCCQPVLIWSATNLPIWFVGFTGPHRRRVCLLSWFIIRGGELGVHGFSFFVKILQDKEEPAIFFLRTRFLIFAFVKWNSSYDMKAFISLCLHYNRSSCEPEDENFKTCHCWSCLLLVVWGKLIQLHTWKFCTFVGREGQNPMWICAAAEPCAGCELWLYTCSSALLGRGFTAHGPA